MFHSIHHTLAIQLADSIGVGDELVALPIGRLNLLCRLRWGFGLSSPNGRETGLIRILPGFDVLLAVYFWLTGIT